MGLTGKSRVRERFRIKGGWGRRGLTDWEAGGRGAVQG